MPEPWDSDPDAPWEDDPEDLPAGLAQRPSVMRPGQPGDAEPSMWDTVREAIFGSPDRIEARDAGMAVQPSTAEMVETGLTGASMVGGGPAALGWLQRMTGGMAGRVPRTVGAVAGAVARNPVKVAAAGGALPGLRRGDPIAAVEGAVAAAGVAAAGARLGRGRKAAPKAPAPGVAPQSAPKPAVDATERVRAEMAAAQAARSSAPAKAATKAELDEFAKSISAPPVAPRPRPTAPAASRPPAAAPAPAAPPVDAGKAAANTHKELMSMAKAAAARNPKIGEKIWLARDANGRPTGLARLKSNGDPMPNQNATWVKNLWE